MSTSRTTGSLWFFLGFWKNYSGSGKNKWRFPEFIKRKGWKHPYFWHDTFGKFIIRIWCNNFFGHKNIKFVDYDDVNKLVAYCFCCERYLEPFDLRKKAKEILERK